MNLLLLKVKHLLFSVQCSDMVEVTVRSTHKFCFQLLHKAAFHTVVLRLVAVISEM